jgi:hypothetical protein
VGKERLEGCAEMDRERNGMVERLGGTVVESGIRGPSCPHQPSSFI